VQKATISIISLILLTISLSGMAQRRSDSVPVGDHFLQVTEWSTAKSKPTTSSVVLLSGPTDNWNSDSAWFARLAPKLAKDYRVITIDRASQTLDKPDVAVGYARFGQDLAALLPTLNLGKTHIIAFASANLSLNQYFASADHHPIASLTLIDPDVLLDYSVSRYKKDAQPFKDNVEQYLAYIGEGKYAGRAEEKNAQELKHLRDLANGDPDVDWPYVEQMFGNRLAINRLQNLFREISRYDFDLDSAVKQPLPTSIPLVVIDTDFEQAYIDKAEDDDTRDGLARWQAEAKTYYQQLAVRSVKGEYLALATQEHLLPFSNPALLIELVNKANE
jgi:pimeloyl-ACP methyl ester carboxylesterase